MENTQTKWAVDPQHSKLQFKVKHLAIANVAGTFKIFSGEVETDKEHLSLLRSMPIVSVLIMK